MNKNNTKIAVVGATGMVGQTMLSILAERGYKIENITAIASDSSQGKTISYGEDGLLTIQSLSNFDFNNAQIALFSPGSEISKVYAPIAAQTGCLVIDNTSYFRMRPDVPLIIPEINGDEIKNAHQTNIIANPNCSTIQLLMALKPLHDLYKIRRVVVSTYQSVSGAGKDAMDELFRQTKNVSLSQSMEKKVFQKPIAFNVIPQIDVFLEDGSTKEEWKMVAETKKILDPKIKVSATCVRVPVCVGHSVSANVEFENDIDIDLDAIRTAVNNASGVILLDNPDHMLYATPLDCAGEDNVYISRLRDDQSLENGINMWIVADNIRKGAALNAIQIAELYMKHKY
jgi:aspartate-semialdehyde dehydrogenase